MPKSFGRLFNLAQKTGNSLIVYDRHGGQDLVILSVDEYEDILDTHEAASGAFDETVFDHESECTDAGIDTDLSEFSEGQMLDKINHDIALWRAHHVAGATADQSDQLAVELAENHFDPFAEDQARPSDWHHAGGILAKIRSQFKPETDQSSSLSVGENSSFEQASPVQTPSLPDRTEPVVDDAPQLQSIPLSESGEVEMNTEESLDDEPIFFEEPVE